MKIVGQTLILRLIPQRFPPQLPDRIWIHAGTELNAGYTW
jgi:hypothetical protein